MLYKDKQPAAETEISGFTVNNLSSLRMRAPDHVTYIWRAPRNSRQS